MSGVDPRYLADLRAGRRTCGDPLCPEPYCWMDRDEDDEPDTLDHDALMERMLEAEGLL